MRCINTCTYLQCVYQNTLVLSFSILLLGEVYKSSQLHVHIIVLEWSLKSGRLHITIQHERRKNLSSSQGLYLGLPNTNQMLLILIVHNSVLETQSLHVRGMTKYA